MIADAEWIKIQSHGRKSSGKPWSENEGTYEWSGVKQTLDHIVFNLCSTYLFSRYL